MKIKTLEKQGWSPALARKCKQAIQSARMAKRSAKAIRETIADLWTHPSQYVEDVHFGVLAQQIVSYQSMPAPADEPQLHKRPAPVCVFGQRMEPEAVRQLHAASRIPVVEQAVMMPDGHPGFGLPIGGVIACRNAVIPFAVGQDIACRMRLSLLDLNAPHALYDRHDELCEALLRDTRFGSGAIFGGRGDSLKKHTHPVMDERWLDSGVPESLKNSAWSQLGSSGGGNHFVEFGAVQIDTAQARKLGAPDAGHYLAILSHSGSRGLGAQVARYFTRIALEHNDRRGQPLSGELKRMAWLDLTSEEGQRYWLAMQLCGRYATACHEVIHQSLATSLGAQVACVVENHHNFAWLEDVCNPRTQEVEKMVVHRKGATPAGEDVLGVIPGSMASPAHIVQGLGYGKALYSASHGAGRRMSRSACKASLSWKHAQSQLRRQDITLLGASVDESPDAYKNIDQVMCDQQQMVQSLATFQPKIVRMAGARTFNPRHITCD